jgi:CheY-like chemotaxis protein
MPQFGQGRPRKALATMVDTVLVVEDDRATAQMIQDALEMEGYHVLRAVGDAAIAIARTQDPAVILLDINMPGMDGLEVSQHLRADPATATIPIICMSSHVASTPVPPEMLHDDRLDKPFALDVLCTTVARWIGHKRHH